MLPPPARCDRWHRDRGRKREGIRDANLYRAIYDNFQAYCKAKWEYGRNYVDRLISAAQVLRRLMTICHQHPNTNPKSNP